MESKSQQLSLADICSDVSYGYTESATNDPVGPRFLRITDIQGGSFNWDRVPFCPASDADARKYCLEVGDIVVARTGNSTGENTQITNEPPSAVFASYLIRFRPDAKRVNPFFVGYQLRAERFRQHVLAVRSGSAQPGANAKQLGAFPIQLIPRALQDSAVETLRSIDDLIALNRQTNATLKAIAQALFKSWFVDFDPVRAKMEGCEPEGMNEATAVLFPSELVESELGLIPKGWRVCPIGDVVETVGGGTPSTKEPTYWDDGQYCWVTPKDLSSLQFPVLLDTERKITQAGVDKISSGLLPVGTLLLSSRAPVGYLAITRVLTAINQGFIAMPPSKVVSAVFLLYWLKANMDRIEQRANGSTFMEISKKNFRPILALIPSRPCLDAFTDIAEALFDRVVQNEQEIRSLTSIRDSLLPKLISGQLRIPEAEEVIGDAL